VTADLTPNPSPEGEGREEYVELFCLVTFTDDAQLLITPTVESDEPQFAEVCIPHRETDRLYGITCYITNYPNWQPVPMEMLILQDFFNSRFAEVLHVFRSTGRGPTA
jgi:hypothetical protein